MIAITQFISRLQTQSCNIQLSMGGDRWSFTSKKAFSFITDSSLTTKYLYLVPYVVFFFFVVISNWAMPDGGVSHVSHLKGISIGSVKHNLHYYIGLLSEFFSGTRHLSIIYGATIPLAIAGAARRCRSDYPAIIYVALVVLSQVIWPHYAGLRYVFPILPFYLSFTLSGFESFWEGTKSPERVFRKILCYASILLVIFYFGVTSMRVIYRNLKAYDVNEGPFAPTSQEMYSYVLNNTTDDNIIIFFKPRVMRLMTGRQSIMINKVEQLNRGDYLCLYLRQDAYNQVSDVEVQRFIEQKSACIVYQNDDFKMYRLGMVCDHSDKNSKHSDN